VVGTGGGALTIAAELALVGVEVTIADTPRFAAGLQAISDAGGIRVEFLGDDPVDAPVAGTSTDPAAVMMAAPLVVVCAPSFGHRPIAELIAPSIQDGQTILWMGEGGGAFATIAALREIGRRPAIRLGESNSLPYGGAKVVAPARTAAMRKTGGTYVAGIPTRTTEEVASIARRIWPWVEPARNVWETLLLNFNAIDHVATVLTNLGSVENRTDVMLLWGEGASPGVARVIGAVDDEYTRLRGALGLPTQLRYEDFLVAQGLVDRKGDTIHQTIKNSLLAEARFQCGPDALEHRFISEDVPFSLVLASSIASELGLSVPVIDGLIAIATAASGHDYRAEGRTLSGWGLAGRGRSGLLAAVDEGWW
jgi:opine dehydrogenase